MCTSTKSIHRSLLSRIAVVAALLAVIEGGWAYLHDVGKIGTPDRILTKPGKLDADEFAEPLYVRLANSDSAARRELEGLIHWYLRQDLGAILRDIRDRR